MILRFQLYTEVTYKDASKIEKLKDFTGIKQGNTRYRDALTYTVKKMAFGKWKKHWKNVLMTVERQFWDGKILTDLQILSAPLQPTQRRHILDHSAVAYSQSHHNASYPPTWTPWEELQSELQYMVLIQLPFQDECFCVS